MSAVARAGRICLDCPAVVAPGRRRCEAHQRAQEALRGSSDARGYGSTHRAVRASLVAGARRSEAMGTPLSCRVCGRWLLPSQQRLEAAHDVPLAADPSSVADALVHAATCNPRGTSKENRPWLD